MIQAAHEDFSVRTYIYTLTDVEIDFLVACRHSLLQVAVLAFGRLPVATDTELPECESDDESVVNRASPTSNAEIAQVVTPIKHVFLKQATKAVSPTTGSPVHVHAHGLHGCDIPGCSAGVRACSMSI